MLPYLSGTFEAGAAYNWVEPDQPNPMRADIFGAPPGWPLPGQQDGYGEVLMRHHPLLLWYAKTGRDAPMASQRVPTAIATETDLGVYRDLFAGSGLCSQISIPMYVHGPDHRAFVVARSADFSIDELHLAALLQPLLRLLYRQSIVLSEAAGAAALQANMTGQELAVLRLMGQGLSARALARRLDISERTAHKHLQNAYRKLSAHDRVSALSAAAAAGLLGPDVNEGGTQAAWPSLMPSPQQQTRGLIHIPAQR